MAEQSFALPDYTYQQAATAAVSVPSAAGSLQANAYANRPEPFTFPSKSKVQPL